MKYEEKKLSELVDTISDTRKIDKDEVVLVNTSDVLAGEVLNHTYTENFNLRGQFKKRFKPDDILYSEIRPANKRFAYVDFDSEDYIASTKLMVLRRKSDKITNRYLYYCLTNDLFVERMQHLAEARSGTFPQITFDVLKGESIYLPSIDDQNKITSILDNINNKIRLNNEINNNLFGLMKNTYVEWFKNYEIPYYKFEFKDSKFGQIPINWNVKHLKDVFFFQEGPGIRNWQYVENNGTKFINIRCIKYSDLELDTANMISNEEAQGKYKHFMLDEWDVVVSTSGTLGRNQIIRKEHLPLCLNTSVIRFKPMNSFDEYAFMYNYLISDEFLNLLDVMATGSAQRNFGPMHLNKIDIVYPDKEILLQFNKLIFPIIENIQNNKTENMRLSQLRNTLLPKLINGEIELDNIEI